MDLRIFVCLAAALAAGGCSLVDSSQSISGSISRSFDWSSSSSEWSKSSSPDDASAAWREDVSNYAASFVREGGLRVAGLRTATDRSALDAFRRGLGELAARQGISDWQRDALLRRAVRVGLSQAGLGPAELARLELLLYDRT